MGLFDGLKVNQLGQRAYSTHVQGNDLQRRGKPAEAKEKYELARKQYEEAFTAGVTKTNLRMSYSVLLMRLGAFTEAREQMREAAKDKTMSEETHFELRANYSVCLWRLGELDKAIETMRYAGKYNKNSTYYSSMGTFLVDKAEMDGDFDTAKALLDEAMDYDDEDGATLDNLGQYYRAKMTAAQKAGDSEEAAQARAESISYYEKALAVKPSQVTTLYALALYAKEDGDKEKALEYTQRAILHCASKVCPISMEMLTTLRDSLH